jgi:hypothetical protein
MRRLRSNSGSQVRWIVHISAQIHHHLAWNWGYCGHEFETA